MTDETNENAKKALAEDRKLSDQSRAEYNERMKGKPTPTQEENDMAMLGAHILTHEDDGSGPDRHQVTRQAEADKTPAKPYTTRAAASGKAE